MRPDRLPPDDIGPNPSRDPPPTPLGSILVLALFAGIPFLVSYPIAAVVAVTTASVGLWAARYAVDRLRGRRRTARIGPVCIPGTSVCLGG